MQKQKAHQRPLLRRRRRPQPHAGPQDDPRRRPRIHRRRRARRDHTESHPPPKEGSRTGDAQVGQPRQARATYTVRSVFGYPAATSAFTRSLYRRNAQVLANFVGQYVTDLGVAKESRPAVLGGLVPPGMVHAFSKKFATVAAQLTQQLAALHKAMRSSSNCSPAAVRAS